MTTMLTLIGEQPIPVLLPTRYIKAEKTVLVYTERTRDIAERLLKMINPGDNLKNHLKVPPYDFDKILKILQQAASNEKNLIFNLTGGTKIMALAAYAVALQTKSNFVYLQSEDKKSLLFHYEFQNGILTRVVGSPFTLDNLINAADYLNAHLPGFDEEGFSCDKNRQLNEGGYFEQAVFNVIKNNGFEVLAGVRPKGVAEQIEIDLIIRFGNQVGIAEVKSGDIQGEAPKKGLDQLAMAGGREYLGIYTAKFLINARKVNSRIRTLAQKRGISIIELPSYKKGHALAQSDINLLIQTIKEKLC